MDIVELLVEQVAHLMLAVSFIIIGFGSILILCIISNLLILVIIDLYIWLKKFVSLIMAFKKYGIVCPHCLSNTYLSIRNDCCMHCNKPIIFTCALCNRKDRVDGFDIYDLYKQSTDVLVCKKCRILDLKNRYKKKEGYLEFKIIKSKYILDVILSVLNVVSSITGRIVKNEIVVLITVLSIILLLIDRFYTQSLVFLVFFPFIFLILAIYSSIRRYKKREKINLPSDEIIEKEQQKFKDAATNYNHTSECE
jgi:hypothetical protein